MNSVVSLPIRPTTGRERVAAEVRAEMSRQKIRINHLPRLLGNSQSYWSRRINAEMPLDVDEVYDLARLLQVPASRFFIDQEAAQPPAPTIRPKLRAIPGEGRDPRPRTTLLTSV